MAGMAVRLHFPFGSRGFRASVVGQLGAGIWACGGRLGNLFGGWPWCVTLTGVLAPTVGLAVWLIRLTGGRLLGTPLAGMALRLHLPPGSLAFLVFCVIVRAGASRVLAFGLCGILGNLFGGWPQGVSWTGVFAPWVGLTALHGRP